MRTGNTKERIAEAALELFSVKGYDGTSVEEIARAVGIKVPSIYDHYKGKEAILQTIADRADEEYAKGMELGKANAVDIRSGTELKGYAMRSISFTLENEIFIKMRRLFTIEQYRNNMFAISATKYQITTLQTVYTVIFQNMMSDGVMAKGNPEIVALEFIAPVTLMIQLCDRQPDKKAEVMKIIEAHLDAFTERYCIENT